MPDKFHILDVIATKKAFPKLGIKEGQVGTVIELLGENHYEIEFTVSKEKETVLTPISGSNLMLLHFEMAEV